VNLHLFENFKAMRLGPGALSKNTWGLGFIESALTVSMFAFHDDRLHAATIGLMVTAYLLYSWMNARVMRDHPQLALLEGAELLGFYRSSQGLMGAPEVADAPAIENPRRERGALPEAETNP
jgi:hypothetical protein